MKVFLVENSRMLRERIRPLVAGVAGVEVVGEAASARTALEGIAATGADTVVLDIHLDGSSGFDVLRGLRERSPQVAVYVLTSFVNEAYRRTAERLGARGFFDKSGEIPRLLGTLSEESKSMDLAKGGA